MADKQQPVQEKKQTKKEVRKQVYEKLAGALADYKTGIGEKKFVGKTKNSPGKWTAFFNSGTT